MRPNPNTASRRSAFSLVEVVIALGIAAFVIVAITGLLPVGLRLAANSSDESRSVNILSAIASDRLTSAASSNSVLYNIPPLNSSQTTTNSFGVSEVGAYVAQDWNKARYRVAYKLQPPASGRLDPWLLSLRITWPAQSTNPVSGLESLVAIPQ